MTPTQQLEATLKALSSDFDALNFDGEHFDAEHFNLNLTNPNDVRAYLARQHETIIKLQRALQSGGGHKGGKPESITSLITHSKGDANIRVIRTSANIPANLPYVLFGFNALAGNFSSIIKPFLPAGVTLATSIDASTGDLLFTYTAGPAVDVVRVNFQGLTTYSDMLNNTTQKYFGSKYVLYTINDPANGQSQFKNTIVFGDLSALGKKDQNQMNIDSRIMTWDFKNDRANLLFPEQQMTAQFAFIDSIIPCPIPDLPSNGGNGFIINWNLFMSSKHGY